MMTSMGLWGHLWGYGDIYGVLGTSMGLWGHLWGYGDIYGAMRISMGLWGHLWGYRDIYGVTLAVPPSPFPPPPAVPPLLQLRLHRFQLRPQPPQPRRVAFGRRRQALPHRRPHKRPHGLRHLGDLGVHMG